MVRFSWCTVNKHGKKQRLHITRYSMVACYTVFSMFPSTPLKTLMTTTFIGIHVILVGVTEGPVV